MRISVARLVREWPRASAYNADPWGCGGPLRLDEVLEAVRDGSHAAASEPWEEADRGDRRYHTLRVAHLAAVGWSEPVLLDLGCPSLDFAPSHPVQDGHHRIAAAIARGDPDIAADVSGEVRWIERFRHRRRARTGGGGTVPDLSDITGPVRPVRIWWDANAVDSGWAFDHHEVTPPGGDAFAEADGLPRDARIRDLLKALRLAVGPRGYVPRAHRWTRAEDGSWTAPGKGR